MLHKSDTAPNLAVFCDYENVAIGAREARYETFNIDMVLERILDKGKIVVKKAYADWDRYKSAKRPLHEAAFELIEIPHLSYSGKNSADIRLVVDALDLCYTKAHVHVFVIISGDSDFSPLVSKLRENNKTVIGLGVKSSSSDLLIDNCDEFIYYDDLVRSKLAAQQHSGSRVNQGKGPRREPERSPDRNPDRRPTRDLNGRPPRPEGVTAGELSGQEDTGMALESQSSPDSREGDDRRGVSVPRGSGGRPSAPSRAPHMPRGRISADRTGGRDRVPGADFRPRGDRDVPAEGGLRPDLGELSGPHPADALLPGGPLLPGGLAPGAAQEDLLGEGPEGLGDVSQGDKEGESEAGGPTTPSRQPPGSRVGGGGLFGAVPSALGPTPPVSRSGRVPRIQAEAIGDRQEALGLVVETTTALLQDADSDLWGSMVKQVLKRKRPNFLESYYGYRSFNELLVDAARQGLLEIVMDPKSGGYRIIGLGPSA